MDLLIVQRPQISEEEISDVRKKFTIEPLEPGFGYTLGNSLRRTLLSSIPGAAITQVKIEQGRGYVPATTAPKEAIGTIPIDALFSPVKRVTYEVEPTRVEQMTNYDRLILDVETNGSMSPSDALSAAGSTLVELFTLFSSLGEGTGGLVLGPQPGAEEASGILATPIEDMDL